MKQSYNGRPRQKEIVGYGPLFSSKNSGYGPSMMADLDKKGDYRLLTSSEFWCYYPHRSRDSVSPVCFFIKLLL